MRRLPLLLVPALLLTLALPAPAFAGLFGVESNSELVNSTVTPAQRGATLDKMKAQGVAIVRVNLGWNELAPAACGALDATTLRNPDNGCYNWSVPDDLVRQAGQRGIQVLVSVSRAPRWLHGSDDSSYLGATSAQWSRTVQHYSAFVSAMATRYAPGSAHGTIKLWTVWNEPNSATYFKPMDTKALQSAAPKRYAQLFARSAVAIKAANPGAVVAIGPTGPNSTIKPITYVRALQAALPTFLPGTGAAERAYIGAWAHNPYPGLSTPPSRGIAKSPVVGMSNIRDLFAQLDAAPITRGLKVWATEFAYQTNPPDDLLGISPALQGRFIGESFDWLDSTGRVPIAIWYGFTDGENVQGDWQGGTYYANGQAKYSLPWWQRAISVPIGITRKGAYVRVWSRSMVKPAQTRIAISGNGRTWRLLPPVGRKADGTTILRTRVLRTTYFATWDGTLGPRRVVLVK